MSHMGFRSQNIPYFGVSPIYDGGFAATTTQEEWEEYEKIREKYSKPVREGDLCYIVNYSLNNSSSAN